ncbi:MAG TPA: cation:proton antiporter [Stellaceae bacterium]|nr:cation:proton antiporter [Stellaceae bacterium]
MHETVLTVFAVTALLGLVSFLLPLAERFSIPYTVLLAIVGIAIGTATNVPAAYLHGGALRDIIATLRDFGLSAESLLYIFLPALLFESALNIDVRQLGDEVAPVLLLAVIGVVVCTLVVGYALWPLAPVGVLACLILGSIIATTDPVAVVGIFREIGAPRRLSTLVQGESLFNDAAAIAIYSLAVAILSGDHPASPLDGLLTFLRQFCGGLAIGYLAGWAATQLMPVLRSSRLAEATMTIGFAYAIYIVCDHYLEVSGVVAVAAAALAVSAEGRRRLAPSNFESLVVTWEQLAFWASSLIFLFAAMRTPDLLAHARWGDFALLGALIAAALTARALTLYGLIPVLSFARIARPIDANYKLFMLWGGMRGAVSLALALAATENMSLPPEIRQFVGVLATGFVLFTLLVTAPTMRPLMRLLKLSDASPAEIALRDRVIGLSLSSMRQEIETVGREHRIAPEIVGAITTIYDAQLRDPADIAEENAQLPIEVRTRAAISVLADREQEFCLEYFEGRTVSRRVAASLLAHTARLRDGARTQGIEGYRRAAARLSAFGPTYRVALAVHRRIGIAGPLGRELSDRFEVQLAARFVLENLSTFNRDQIGRLFGAGPSKAMVVQLDLRLAEINRAIAALKLQYPGYVRRLETQFLARTAARFEEERYRRLRAESIINQEVFEDLQRKLRRRRHTVEMRMVLDLGLKRSDLISRVPMFAVLDERVRQSVARLLRPRLAVPDEAIVRRGERGDAMYFISSGAVEVRITPQPVQLGSGDFFGEMALLVADRRNADVVALGYCQLLTLAARDLHRLFDTEPALREQIRAVARARIAAPTEASQVRLSPVTTAASMADDRRREAT